MLLGVFFAFYLFTFASLLLLTLRHSFVFYSYHVDNAENTFSSLERVLFPAPLLNTAGLATA